MTPASTIATSKPATAPMAINQGFPPSGTSSFIRTAFAFRAEDLLAVDYNAGSKQFEDVLETMQILIIEDEQAIVRFLERGLTVHGHRVLSANNGSDGALLAADEAVDLVVLDIMLPGLDGHNVLKRIRETRPALP